MKFYVGPWVWGKGPLGGSLWRPPNGATNIIDLRPIPAQGLSGEVSGFGVFATPDDVTLSSDYRLFGTGGSLADIGDSKDKSVFASMVGVKAVDGDSLSEWLFTLCTLYADPLGDTAVRPLLPINGKHFSAFGIIKPFSLNGPEAAGSIAVIRDDYRKLRAASLAGRLGHDGLQHRRVLDFLGKQYGINNPQDVFIPGDLPKEAPVPHATTINDDFTRANGTGLGTATVASVSQGWSWTCFDADGAGTVSATNRLNIVSNKAALDNASGSNYGQTRSGSALSSADHFAQITTGVVGTGSNNPQLGPVARFANSGTNISGYQFRALPIGSNGFDLEKVSATGVQSQLAVSAAVQVADGKVMKLTANGSAISCDYDAGSLTLSVTDTSVTGNVNCGMYAVCGNTLVAGPTFGGFTASDLATGAFSISPSSGHTAGSLTVTVTYSGGAICPASMPISISSGGGSVASWVQDVSGANGHGHFTFTEPAASGTPTVFADSVTSTTQSFSDAAVVPGAPTIGTLTNNQDSTISIAFIAPADNGGASITSYVATSSSGGITGSGSSSPIIITGVNLGVSQTVTVTATNSAGTGSASSASNAVTPTTLLRQVATNSNICFDRSALGPNIMSRSRHYARDTLTTIQIALPNWYAAVSSGISTETGSGNAITAKAGILYGGVATPFLWSGSATVTIADGTTSPLSDPLTVSIPSGGAFFIQTYINSPNTQILSNSSGGVALDTANGEECRTGTISDQSTSTSVPLTGGTNQTGLIYRPVLIVAPTTKPSFIVYGDSRCAGVGDSYTGTSGDHGSVIRGLGSRGYINCGVPADTAAGFLTSHTGRLALAAYADHAVVEYGLNDVGGPVGHSAAQTGTDLSSIAALLSGDIRQATPATSDTSSDSWATTANQTVGSTFNGVMNTLRTNIRAVLAGFIGFLEISDILQNTSTDGLWKVNGTPFWYTTDGSHETNTANLAVAASMLPGAPTIGTLTDNHNGTVTIAFTPASEVGKYPCTFTATSSVGGILASGPSSPITIPGVTLGSAQTVSVTATSVLGTSSASGNSNSVTPSGRSRPRVRLGLGLRAA